MVPLTSFTSQSATLEVTNDPPVADAGEDITGYLLNEIVELNGTLSTDDDIDNCTWVWESTTHPSIEVTPENSSIPSFTVNVEETITFLLTLTDPSGEFSTDEVDVIIEENQDPHISIDSPPPSGSEGPFYEISKPIEFNANTTTDPEGRELTFEWESNVSGTIGTERYLSTHINELGWHEITLTVEDPNGGSAQESFNIKIREDPFTPVANIYLKPSRPDLRYSKSEIITLDASGTTDDNSFDTIETMNFTWSTNLSGGMVLGYGHILEVLLDEGFHNITLEVIDADGLDDSEYVLLEAYNSPPEARVEAPTVKLRNSQPTINVSESAEFTGTYSTDPDDDELSFSWDFGDGNVGVGESVSNSWNQWGSYNVTLTVNDGSTNDNKDSVDFIIYVNSVPIAVADQGITVEVGESFTITANGSYDEDGDDLEYRWDFDGDGQFDSSRNDSTWNFDEEGEYEVILQVSDGFAWSEAVSIVKVFFPNSEPIASVLNEMIDGEILVPLSDDRGEVDLDASSSIDPDDDADGSGEIDGREKNNLTYSWDLDSSEDSGDDGIPDNDVDDTGKKITVKLTGSGLIRVMLNVSDPRGKFDILEIPIRGDHPPGTLSIRTGPATKVLVGAQVTFTGSARDDDRSDQNKLEYYFDFGDGETSTGSSFQSRHTYYEEGDYEVKLTVTDGLLESTTQTTISVVEMDQPQISYPTDGSEVSGIITLSGRIREVRNFEVDRVEIKIGTSDWKMAEGTTQWSYSVNTARYPNGNLDIIIRYTVNDAEAIQTELEITVKVQNAAEGGIDWVPFIIGAVILLVVLVPLFILFRRKPRRWEQILPPPGPGPSLPPRVAPGGLPPGQVKQALPPTGAQPPSEKEAPDQAEPPKEEKPKQIRIKCPACTKVFKVTDSGERPLHIACKHCGANGSIDQVPGDAEAEPTEEEAPPQEPGEEEVKPEPIPIVCPSCQNLFELDEVTDTAKCPICGAEGDLDEGTVTILKERFGEKESVEMTLKCPSCAGTFKVKENDTSIICPFCGAKGKASA